MARDPIRDDGFTLLELLVALVVFGFLLIGLSQGVHFGLQAWDRQARTIDARGDLDAVDRALRTLIARLDPAAQVGGRAHAMVFTTVLPETAALPTRQADVLLQVDAGHRLVLRWVPHLHAQRFGPAPTPQDAQLLSGVARLDIAYWSHTGAGGWADTWNEDDPPALVRLRMVFAEGDPRRWPEIVVAPMRDRLGN